MNLYEKLVEIRKEVINFSKDTEGYGYKYVSGSQAIAKIRDKMDELGIILVPGVGDTITSTYDYINSKGKECTDHVVSGDMSYTWINAEEPSETLIVPWKLYGAQDDISKAFGSGLTYSERYFILKFFQAHTDDADPDNRDTSNRGTGAKKGLSEAQVKRLYAIANAVGYDQKTIKQMVTTRYNKAVEQLTKAEYDHVCNGLEDKKNG